MKLYNLVSGLIIGTSLAIAVVLLWIGIMTDTVALMKPMLACLTVAFSTLLVSVFVFAIEDWRKL